MEDNIKDWDYTPLDIMEDTFPKWESTKCFEEQIVASKKMIEIGIRG